MNRINILGSCVSKISLMNGHRNLHGIYGDDMKQVYFLDKQNIMFAMMPAPFLYEEINKISDSELYDRTRLRTLKQCLDKSTIKLLMESDANYLVMDLYDFHNDFILYNNTAFSTCAHEFMNTELFNKNKSHMKIANLMNMPDDFYYPFVDMFFDKIMAKYDSSHIIINRFRSNEYYLAKDGNIKKTPEEFLKPFHSNYVYNNKLRKLEDYIISRYNPYVIDLSPYYMGNENEWDNLNGAHFENAFYTETYKYICEIIKNKPEKRYYNTPHYMWDLFGIGDKDELKYAFNIDCALNLLQELVEKEDVLWVNILHKLNIYAKDNPVVIEYTKACLGG